MKSQKNQVSRLVRTTLPAAIAVAVMGAVVLALQPQQPAPKASAIISATDVADQPVVTETPAAQVSRTNVTVNGKEVPAGVSSRNTTSTEHGSTTVDTSEEGTKVSSTDQPSDQPNKSSDLNVSVNSSSNGGSSWGNTYVFGSSFSHSSTGTAEGSTSTHVFSADSANVSVSQ